MSTTLPLEHMTTEEKLAAMEELWADLSRNQQQFVNLLLGMSPC